ncbi:GNAT family N-acetyltransferase [Gordonia sp. PKS22-38]|uniref:GNAT family N-acetyltransferase n=1 Tax=Gordonia prachuapensis TaxID=3115651 RepID=A0ABU7MT74_9ACTN|nr:GNAT family N-acetyltransferase [Gordonia sp. PKS22-38]
MSANGPEIRELTDPADLDKLTRVFDDVWHPDPANRPVSVDMLRALSHAGNYVAGAFVGDRLAGGSVAFFAAPVGTTLHSHMTGVSRIGRGHNVGSALKMHQRGWALARGITTITWTFDPLVARNAYFNIAKLGAAPIAYHRDFYGDLGDELGGGDESDRLLMSWALDVPLPEPTDETVDDVVGAGGRMGIETTGEVPKAIAESGSPVVIPVPRDIEAMRRTDPVAASHWRTAVRDALAPHFASDTAAAAPATRFLRSGHYVVAADE